MTKSGSYSIIALGEKMDTIMFNSLLLSFSIAIFGSMIITLTVVATYQIGTSNRKYFNFAAVWALILTGIGTIGSEGIKFWANNQNLGEIFLQITTNHITVNIAGGIIGGLVGILLGWLLRNK